MIGKWFFHILLLVGWIILTLRKGKFHLQWKALIRCKFLDLNACIFLFHSLISIVNTTMFTSWSHFLNSSVIILIIILSKKFKRFLVWKFFTMVVFKKVTVNNVCWIFFLVWHWCEQGEFLRPDCPRHRQLLHYLQSSQRSQASTER